MKRILALVLVLIMVFAFAACGNSNPDSKSDTTPKVDATQKPDDAASRPGDDASKLQEAGVSTGALNETVTTLDPDHGVTVEGKSENLKITIGLSNDMAGTAPFASGAGRNDTKYLTYDNLAVMHFPGGSVDEMDWVIAKNITKVDDDTYDIEIYDYVHDWAGNNITADDVIFSYESYVASGASGKFSRLFGSMEKLGDYSVRLHIASNALGNAQYLLQNCPIVSKAAYESQTEAELAQNPIGTGMYKISEFVSGSYITFKRVDDYWQTDRSKWPYLYSGQLEEIKIVIMTEASQRAIALENGSIDVVPVVAIEDISNFMNDDGSAKEGYNVLKVLNSGVEYGIINTNEASICSDFNVRLAISYAIDRAGVMNGAYGKGGWLATNEVATSVVGDYNSDWTWYEYDDAKAKESLAASAYNNEEIKIVCEASNYQKTEAEMIQAYLSAIGMTATINAYDSATLTEVTKDPSKWDIRLSTAGSSDYCTDSWNVCFSGTIVGILNDPQLTEKLNEAGGLQTHSAETVDAMHQYLYDNCYTIPLGTYYKYSAAHDNMLLWAVHPWNYCTYGGFIFK